MEDSEENVDENPFSQYYGMLLHQQNMLQDYVRTTTYQRAIMENAVDFKDKVVLDVGTGTGILAYFAVKAGAKHVYAVELSDMADVASELVRRNGLGDKITIIKAKMENAELPGYVDLVISEPMGFFLVHERMLEIYVNAGKRWRDPQIKDFRMFPSVGTMLIAPFSDENIYREQMSKVAFWQNTDFYGLDLSCMTQRAVASHFSQPVVGYFPSSMLLCDMSEAVAHEIDFANIEKRDLQDFTIPFRFTVDRTAIMHGFGCWFTVSFIGTASTVVLSTAPDCPGTHWYQCRLLLPSPIAINASQLVSGTFHFVCNKKYSYDIQIEAHLDGTGIKSCNTIHLQNQMYHYLYSQGPEQTSYTEN